MNPLSIQIGYQQLLEAVRQLPENQLSQLMIDIKNNISKPNVVPEVSDFQQFLLSAPTMSKKQHEEFTENRKKFNQWRTL